MSKGEIIDFLKHTETGQELLDCAVLDCRIEADVEELADHMGTGVEYLYYCIDLCLMEGF